MNAFQTKTAELFQATLAGHNLKCIAEGQTQVWESRNGIGDVTRIINHYEDERFEVVRLNKNGVVQWEFTMAYSVPPRIAVQAIASALNA